MAISNIVASDTNGYIRVSWTYPSNNIDGTELDDLAGAKVYWGTASSNYTHIATVTNSIPGIEGSTTITGLEIGTTYYINGTAFNVYGLESDFCQEVAKVAVSTNTPSAPVILRMFEDKSNSQ